MKLRNKNTGEVIETCKIIQNAFGEIIMFTMDEEERYPYEYHSLSELNEDWEDYTPAEPLIKDEKIRKLVKEWATLFEEHRKIKYYEYDDFVAFRLCRKKGTPDPELDISIDYELVNLREGHEYDFEELCGEEE